MGLKWEQNPSRHWQRGSKSIQNLQPSLLLCNTAVNLHKRKGDLRLWKGAGEVLEKKLLKMTAKKVWFLCLSCRWVIAGSTSSQRAEQDTHFQMLQAAALQISSILDEHYVCLSQHSFIPTGSSLCKRQILPSFIAQCRGDRDTGSQPYCSLGKHVVFLHFSSLFSWHSKTRLPEISSMCDSVKA